MTENRNIGQDVQAEILKTVRRGQEAVVEAIKTWTDTVRTMTPPLSDVRLPFASRCPSPRNWSGTPTTSPGSCWPASGSSPRMCCTRPRRCCPAATTPAGNGEQAPGSKAAQEGARQEERRRSRQEERLVSQLTAASRSADLPAQARGGPIMVRRGLCVLY